MEAILLETEEYENRAKERFKTHESKEQLLSNELLSRERIRESPPNILLTNYAMLEFLLLRPSDNSLLMETMQDTGGLLSLMKSIHILVLKE